VHGRVTPGRRPGGGPGYGSKNAVNSKLESDTLESDTQALDAAHLLERDRLAAQELGVAGVEVVHGYCSSCHSQYRDQRGG
jgi:hypothetical protein